MINRFSLVVVDMVGNCPHRQVPAKVTAYVDEDMKELVELLNTLEDIQTTDSCQGYEGEMSHICFDYGDIYDAQKTFIFVEKLANGIRRVAIDELGLLGHSIWLSIEWSGSMRIPTILLKFSYRDIKDVTIILQKVRNQLGGVR